MSAMTMSPARVSAGGSTSGSLGAASVTVRPASIDGADRLRRIGGEPRRQIDGDHRNARRVDVGDDRLDEAGHRRVQAGPEDRVDDQRAVADLGEVQLPGLAVGDLDDGQAEAAENLEVDAGVAAHVGDAADEEHRDVDAALDAACARRRSRRRRCCRGRRARRPAARADRCRPPPSPRPPGGRRSPSARARRCRSPRSSGDRLRASARRSVRAFRLFAAWHQHKDTKDTKDTSTAVHRSPSCRLRPLCWISVQA